MILSLDLNSEMPIYQQLRNQIVIGMASGRLKPGDPLPSVRQLGVDLGINLHTVNKAYAQLRQEGFLIIHRQKGVVIADAASRTPAPDWPDRFRSELTTLLAEASLRGLDEAAAIEGLREVWRQFEGTPASTPADKQDKEANR